jgi:phosphatidylglycerophosphate synthase
MAGAGLADLRAKTYKSRDAWWTVLFVDPVASRLTYVVARRTRITPNQLTVLAFAIGMGAAGCFAAGDFGWLIAGAVLYHLSFVVDCMDGKLARYQGSGSIFGGWLDYVLDRVRVLGCTLALMGGQYADTENGVFLLIALVVVFLDMFRYLNSLQVFKVRSQMRRKIEDAYGDIDRRPVFIEDILRAAPERERALAVAKDTDGVVDLQREFRSRFGWYLQFRDFLLRHRVRTHLISGVEFQMAVFIIGPLTGAVISTTVVAGVLLLVFELAVIYKLYLSTRDFSQAMGDLGSQPGQSHAGSYSPSHAAVLSLAVLDGVE